MGKIRFLFLLVIIVALLFISYLFPTFAADETASEIMKGISSSFSLPLRVLLKIRMHINLKQAVEKVIFFSAPSMG